jgi:two-component system sensor histidine kinase/response regulator
LLSSSIAGHDENEFVTFDACLVKPILEGVLLRALCRAYATMGVPTDVDSATQRDDPADDIGGGQSVRGHVLLVEDNEINQEVAVQMLKAFGYSVEVAVNGREAVERFSLQRHQLVLMDCQMPVLDGYEATAELRRKYPTERIPILAMTAHAMQGEREKCLAAGMDDYLSKPISVANFKAALEKWCVIETDSRDDNTAVPPGASPGAADAPNVGPPNARAVGQ